MHLVGRYVKSSGDVADVTQEAFIKAYRALPSFRGDSAFTRGCIALLLIQLKII